MDNVNQIYKIACRLLIRRAVIASAICGIVGGACFLTAKYLDYIQKKNPETYSLYINVPSPECRPSVEVLDSNNEVLWHVDGNDLVIIPKTRLEDRLGAKIDLRITDGSSEMPIKPQTNPKISQSYESNYGYSYTGL